MFAFEETRHATTATGHSLFVVPQRTTEPDGDTELSDPDNDGSYVKAVIVNLLEPTHHFEYEENDDQTL